MGRKGFRKGNGKEFLVSSVFPLFFPLPLFFPSNNFPVSPFPSLFHCHFRVSLIYVCLSVLLLLFVFFLFLLLAKIPNGVCLVLLNPAPLFSSPQKKESCFCLFVLSCRSVFVLFSACKTITITSTVGFLLLEITLGGS